MSYTNKTPNYDLPQYVGTDKPTYLGDFNETMLKIDEALHTNQQNIASANSVATTANATANQALQSATDANTKASTASTTANQAKTIAENASTLSETIQSEIQNLLKFSRTDNITANSMHVFKTGTTTSAGTINSQSNIQVFSNTSKHLLYFSGIISISNLSTDSPRKFDVVMNTSFTPASNISVNNLALSTVSEFNGQFSEWVERFVNVTFYSDGRIKFTFENPYSTQQLITFFPFLINI